MNNKVGPWMIKYFSFIVFFILLIGCKVQTVQKVPVESVEESPKQLTIHLRGAEVPPELWHSRDTIEIKLKISALMKRLSEVEFDEVFFRNKEVEIAGSQGMDQLTTDFDVLSFAVREAKKYNLKIYSVLDLPDLMGKRENDSDPGHYPDEINDGETKRRFVNYITHLVSNYDIDGLQIRFPVSDILATGTHDQDTPSYSPIIDLAENILAKALLIKPFLITSISPENTRNSELDSVNWGLLPPVDFISPVVRSVEQLETLKAVLQDSLWDINPSPMYPTVNFTPEIQELFSEEPHIGYEIFQGVVFILSESIKWDQAIMTNRDSMIIYNKIAPLKRIKEDQVIGIDLSNFMKGNTSEELIRISPGDKIKQPDASGWTGVIFKMRPDTLTVNINTNTLQFSSRFWKAPIDFAILPDGKVTRKNPWLEFRQIPEKVIGVPEVHILCKTDPSAKAWIGGDTVKVYKTGVFFNKINLEEGANRIEAGVIINDSITTQAFREVDYLEEESRWPEEILWIDRESINPNMSLELTSEDDITVQFSASPHAEGTVILNPGDIQFLCTRENFDKHAEFTTKIDLTNLEKDVRYTISIRIGRNDQSGVAPDTLSVSSDASIIIKEINAFPYVKTIDQHVRLTYNMGQVRLGGPLRAELPEEIILKTNGKIGDQYRIYLNDLETGFLDQDAVEELPLSYSRDPYYITSLSCGPGKNMDVVSIPYDEDIPYSIFPEPDQKRIRIRLYGARSSSTWVSHHKGRKIVKNITWAQPTDNTYEVIINLKNSKIWGYKMIKEDRRLILSIKHPPDYSLAPSKPLNGISIAIEAGHGGDSYGALGLSGLFEKDINLALARELADICQEHGAEIRQIRKSDTTLSLLSKRERAITSDADLLISLHANAASTRQGFLRVGGTSTYYHNPFWADFAEIMYDHLIELNISEFGVVGSFNYTVIRMSEMPAILVEQAFMTHAKDEEKLADPSFRRKMALKIYEGVLDYLKFMKSK